MVIATEDSSIGMGGPAMIEGGGLGVYEPGEVGPIDVQDANGVVDLRVPDDAAAVAAAKRYLSYFARPPHGARPDPPVPDQARLRDLIPANRKRVYAVRDVIDGRVRRGVGPRAAPGLRARAWSPRWRAWMGTRSA